MVFGLLVSLFVLLCIVLVILILVQKGKSSLGLGNFGGGTQMLFGGSGGQDFFQKLTWVLGALFMGCSLVLALWKSSLYQESKYLSKITLPQTTASTATSTTTTPEEEAPAV